MVEPPEVQFVKGDDGAFLPDAEWAALSKAATPKRRADFVRGRRAAHAAVQRFAARRGDDASGVLVLPESGGPTRGRPRLSGLPAPAHVSITHAGAWAGAAVCDEAVGIDLVHVEPQPSSFLDEVFSPAEWRTWRARSPGPAEAAALGFAAKEAAVKWLGTGLRQALRRVSVEWPGPRWGLSALEEATVPEPVPTRVHIGDRQAEVFGAAGWVNQWAVFVLWGPGADRLRDGQP